MTHIESGTGNTCSGPHSPAIGVSAWPGSHTVLPTEASPCAYFASVFFPMKPSRLKEHLTKVHPERSRENVAYFRKLRDKIMNRPTQCNNFTDDCKVWQTTQSGSSCWFQWLMRKISLSKDTVQRLTDDMAVDVEEALCDLPRRTKFSLQLPESTLLVSRTSRRRFYELFESVLSFFADEDVALRDMLELLQADNAYLVYLYEKFNAMNLQLQLALYKRNIARADDQRVRCRRCGSISGAPESLAHISQTCMFTQGLVIRRHDAVVDRIVSIAKDAGYDCLREPILRCEGQTWKPDLVLYKGESSFIVDVAVPYESKEPVMRRHHEKCRKYERLKETVCDLTKTKNCDTGAIVIGARGAWCPRNDDSLKTANIPITYQQKALLCLIVMERTNKIISWFMRASEELQSRRTATRANI
uniref:Reverse transcriptase zinc-binding domain-containing protein n=1 Tax=Trichuris muris TaxID=70415 RepID=A0A5S6QGX2_TRIMR